MLRFGFCAATLVACCVAPASFACTPQYSAAKPTPCTWRAQTVLNSVGVNTHIGYDGSSYNGVANLARIKSALANLGITNIRDAFPEYVAGDPRLAPYRTLMGAGITMSLVTSGAMESNGYADYWTMLAAQADALEASYPGKIMAIEGLNEPDVGPGGYTYLNLSGYQAVAQYQIDLANHVRADPQLLGVRVFEFNMNTAPYDKTPYELVYAANPAVLDAFDWNSRGTYPGPWSDEFVIQQQTLHSFDINETNTGTGSYAFRSGPYAGKPNLGRALFVKETGQAASVSNFGILGTVDYTVQAKLYPGIFLDNLANGATAQRFYELVDVFPDPNNTNGQYHFGLYDSNWHPKPVVGVLGRLFRYLQDTQSSALTFSVKGLTATVSGFPLVTANSQDSGSHLVMEKSDGTYYIAVWYSPYLWNNNAELPVPQHPKVTLNTSITCTSSEIYDPYLGTTAPGPSNSNHIPISLPEYPVVVRCAP